MVLTPVTLQKTEEESQQHDVMGQEFWMQWTKKVQKEEEESLQNK